MKQGAGFWTPWYLKPHDPSKDFRMVFNPSWTRNAILCAINLGHLGRMLRDWVFFEEYGRNLSQKEPVVNLK